MKQLALACLVAAGFSLANTSTSEAGGGIAISVGGPGYHFGYRRAGFGFGAPVLPVDYGYGYHGHSVFHDTSHWAYTPGRVVHFPGGYDYTAPTYRFQPSGYWSHYGPGPGLGYWGR